MSPRNPITRDLEQMKAQRLWRRAHLRCRRARARTATAKSRRHPPLTPRGRAFTNTPCAKPQARFRNELEIKSGWNLAAGRGPGGGTRPRNSPGREIRVTGRRIFRQTSLPSRVKIIIVKCLVIAYPLPANLPPGPQAVAKPARKSVLTALWAFLRSEFSAAVPGNFPTTQGEEDVDVSNVIGPQPQKILDTTSPASHTLPPTQVIFLVPPTPPLHMRRFP